MICRINLALLFVGMARLFYLWSFYFFGCLLKKGTNTFSLAIRRTAKTKFASKAIIQELAQTDMGNSIPVASFYEWSH